MTETGRPKSKQIVPLIALIVVAVGAIGIQYSNHLRRMAEIKPGGQGPQQPAASSQTIPQMLLDINARQDPARFKYLNRGRAIMMRNMLADTSRPMDASTRMNVRVMLANELVNAGMTADAIKECDDIITQVKQHSPETWSEVGSELLILQAIAYLRTGEEQNCCSANNSDSCLLPISGRGIHTKPYGSTEAIKRLTEALRLKPGDLSARWLLNIAYMTLGGYPDKVPAKWLIPMKAYGGQAPQKPFYNAAADMGLDLLGWAGGVALEDFEGNGLLDIMVSCMNPTCQLRYFHNNGDGTFTERTKEAGIIGEIGGLNFITTDYNNDGRVDVVVLRGGWYGKSGHYPLSLLRNDGNGHFTDVTLEAGLLTLGPTQTAVAFDYNGDGFLDLFVGYESKGDDQIPCKLFRNNGDGTFTDVTEECGIHVTGFVKAVISADYMKNGRPGLYISCAEQPNVLLRNDGPAGPDKSPKAAWKFTDVSHQAGVDKQKVSFSCFFFDYDNDGWPDIYVGGYGGVKNVGDVAADYLGLPTGAERARLYRNNRNGTFTDVTKEAHLDRVILGMGINFGDLDNDGWLDFYSGTGNPDLGMLIPKRMFRNHDGKYFDEVTTSGRFGHLQKGHGIAFADLNNTGQQDVFEVMGGAFEGDTARSCLYINPGNANHWVTLQLTGTKSNRVAIGAEVCVTVATPQGERKMYRTVGPGGSFGNNPLRREIGLGNATAIKQVSIRWPASGIQQVVTGIAMDGFYKVTEGNPTAEKWIVPTFKLPHGPGKATGAVARTH